MVKTVVILPGEGIGLEVIDATCEVLAGADMPLATTKEMAQAVLDAYRHV